MWHS